MEEILPPETESGAGFEPVRVRQFTVFLENRVGRLQSLVRTYEQKSGRIVSLSIQNQADTALVRIICSDPDLARQVLQDEAFAFAEQELLVVELPKGAQPLSSICTAILAAELNIHYAYPLLVRPGGPALAIYPDDLTLAAQLLIKKGFTILGESDLAK
ncbi:MAG: acetolactate synthase [Bacillota bacterium]